MVLTFLWFSAGGAVVWALVSLASAAAARGAALGVLVLAVPGAVPVADVASRGTGRRAPLPHSGLPGSRALPPQQAGGRGRSWGRRRPAVSSLLGSGRCYGLCCCCRGRGLGHHVHCFLALPVLGPSPPPVRCAGARGPRACRAELWAFYWL